MDKRSTDESRAVGLCNVCKTVISHGDATANNYTTALNSRACMSHYFTFSTLFTNYITC